MGLVRGHSTFLQCLHEKCRYFRHISSENDFKVFEGETDTFEMRGSEISGETGRLRNSRPLSTEAIPGISNARIPPGMTGFGVCCKQLPVSLMVIGGKFACL